MNFKLIDNFIEHALTRIARMKMRLKNHVNEVLCLMISLKKFDLIFDMFWIKEYDVNIEKNNRALIFKSKHCLHHCLSNQQSSKILNKTSLNKRFKLKFFKKLFSHRKKIDVNCDAIFAKIFMMITARNDHEVVVLWLQHFKQLKKLKKTNQCFVYSNLTTNFSIISTNDYEKFFVKYSKTFITKEKLKKRISKKFHKYIDV